MDSTPELVPYGLGMIGALSPEAVTASQNMQNSNTMVCVIDTGIYASSLASDLPTGLVGGMAPTGTNPDMTNQCAFNWNQGQLHGGHVMGTVAAPANAFGVRGVSG